MPGKKKTKPAALAPSQGTLNKRWAVAEMAGRGHTTREIAEKLGISDKSVYYHLDHAETQAYLKQIRSALIESVSDLLASSTNKAIRTLSTLCDDASPSIQVRAASALLGHFRDITKDNIMTSQSTPELVMAALPIIVQTIGKDAIMDAIGVEVTNATANDPTNTERLDTPDKTYSPHQLPEDASTRPSVQAVVHPQAEEETTFPALEAPSEATTPLEGTPEPISDERALEGPSKPGNEESDK